jgi:hypothetical protein
MDIGIGLPRRPVGVYLHFGDTGSLADAYMCVIETTSGGTLIVRNPDDDAAIRIVLAHLNYPELQSLVQALYAHRKIA